MHSLQKGEMVFGPTSVLVYDKTNVLVQNLDKPVFVL